MQVLRGAGELELGDDEVRERAAGHAHVVVDVGTGDARQAYRMARAHPDWLVIGLDPAADRLRDVATRIARKPARGGLDNLLLVCSTVEAAPAALHGLGHQVQVILPWGSLLRGTSVGDPAVLAAVRALARPGASVQVVLGTNIWDDPVPVEVRDLEPVTVASARRDLVPRYDEAGLTVVEVRALDPAEARSLPSSWARRLAAGRADPKFVLIAARAR